MKTMVRLVLSGAALAVVVYILKKGNTTRKRIGNATAPGSNKGEPEYNQTGLEIPNALSDIALKEGHWLQAGATVIGHRNKNGGDGLYPIITAQLCRVLSPVSGFRAIRAEVLKKASAL